MQIAIRRFLRGLFGSNKPDWQAQASLVFKDSKGVRWYRYEDELDIPIARMDACDIVIKEIDNRISMIDLKAHLDNHDRILLSDQKAESKVKQIADHTRWLQERMDIPPAPELLMKIVALFYIREDENPGVLDEKLQNEKVRHFLAEAEGGLVDFFCTAGLRKYLPLSNTSTQNTEELLKLAQKIAEQSRLKEGELRAALS